MQHRLEQMREYSRNYRAIKRADTAEERTLHLTAKERRKEDLKAHRKLVSEQKAEARKQRKNEARRLRYAKEKPIDWVDGRNLRKLNKPVVVKPLKVRTIKADKVKPVVNRLPNREIDTATLKKLQLDSKTVIFIRPDQDAEAIKLKFINRK